MLSGLSFLGSEYNIVKLAIDIHKIEKYFPLEYNEEGRLDYEMAIDRKRYDAVESLLGEYGITDAQVVLESCFILLWIEKSVGIMNDDNDPNPEFAQMWEELDLLKEYLLKNRVISISFSGELVKNKPGKTLTLREEINIDRICDGIRSVFRDEFDNDKERRRSKGKKAWYKRKMIKVRNNILNYMAIVPGLDILSLEKQNHLIEKIGEIAWMRPDLKDKLF